MYCISYSKLTPNCFIILKESSEKERLIETNDKVRKLRSEVHEVRDIMKDNIEKVIERDGKVALLNERAGNNTDVLTTPLLPPSALLFVVPGLRGDHCTPLGEA